jgi:HAD superfamily hydrolase (TIGR01509 family)
MKCRFNAKGHENILATHKKTLELTKDKELSLDGDCIVGVGADFEPVKLQQLVRNHKRLVMRIKAGDISDEIGFIANKGFNSSREIVLRFSEFISDRTLGFRAAKSSADLDKKLVKRLRDPKQGIVVEIEPMVKVAIFDFDNTIEDLHVAIKYTHEKLAKLMFDEFGVYGPTTVKLLYDIDKEFSIRGVHSKPMMFDRHLWLAEYFKRIGIEVSKKRIDELVGVYWDSISKSVKPMPNAISMLKELRKQCRIVVISDSDGTRKLKVDRVKKVGMYELIDLLMTSDDLGVNKPDKRFYDKVFERFGIAAENCVMVGDKPEVDLKLAKELGMQTVWMKYGGWTKRLGNARFDYVDHEIRDLKQLLGLLKEM